MADPIDWDRERARANQHTQRSLIALAKRAGFEVRTDRGRGSHVVVTRPGIERSIAIPSEIHRQMALAIIRQLRRASDE